MGPLRRYCSDTPPGGRRLLRVQGDAEDLVRFRVKGTFGLGLGLGLGLELGLGLGRTP